ncbi:hypothetical protein EDC04DRAFT_2777066 [Pisolithus marmoratus]|nr:hypothetical protein EDC04DRAFT_2777066 [Pisolithus marmoratus]
MFHLLNIGFCPQCSVLGSNAEEHHRIINMRLRFRPRYIVQPANHFDALDPPTFGSAMVPLDPRKLTVRFHASIAASSDCQARKPDHPVDIVFLYVSRSPCSFKFGSSAFVGAETLKSDGKAQTIVAC